MKRTLTILLALLLACSILPACTDKGTDAPASTSGAATTLATEAPATTLYKEDNLPADLDFKGATIMTFGWSGPKTVEFFVEAPNGEVVNDAIYERNAAVEERMNVKLEYHLPIGDNANRANWVKEISTSVLAGDAAYDITAGYSMCLATLAYQHYVQDLNKLPYLDFTEPWWPDSLQKESVVNGKLYFASGDISTYMIVYMLAEYVNMDLVKDFGLEDPRELVKSGKWTFDKLSEMSAKCYKDVNGDGAKDLGDNYGYVSHITYTDSYYYAAGLHVAEIGDKGLPILSPDYSSEKVHTLLNYLIDMYKTNPGTLLKNYDTVGDKSAYTACTDVFAEGRTVFLLAEVTSAITAFRDVEFPYTIIPVPKWDETQENYRTTMSFPYSLYGVPLDAKDPKMSAAVMECLASESYRTVSPALFETALKVKYAADDGTAEMYDILRATVTFDIGRIFNDSMSSLTYSMFRNALLNGNGDWASVFKNNEGNLTAKFNDVIDALAKGE